MPFAGLQALLDIQSLLTNNWISANTDNTTPEITNNLEKPWSDIDLSTTDTIYVKFDVETNRTGVYALEFYKKVAFSIEVLSPKVNAINDPVQHFKKLIEEVTRIIEANPRQTGYAYTLYNSAQIRYNKDKAVFLCTLDGEVFKVQTAAS